MKEIRNAHGFDFRGHSYSSMILSTAMVVEALKTLGKSRVTDDMVVTLRVNIPEDAKQTLLVESQSSSEWIYETVRKVCANPQNTDPL